MELRYTVPPAALPLLDIAQAKVTYDASFACYAIFFPRLSKMGKVYFHRFRIFPDLEDWQDAVRQALEYEDQYK